MLWVKSFHIIFVVSWFAGLFYLPRIFVNHAMATEPAEVARLKLMEGKLYRFVADCLAGAGFRHMVVAGLWHHRGLDVCKTPAGAGAGRLSLYLRQAGQTIRRRPQYPRPCLLPLVQRGPGTRADGCRYSRHRKTILNTSLKSYA